MRKQEIADAILLSLESRKLFILSMLNYRNNRFCKEDRLTSELASKFSNGFLIPQYKIQNENGQEYIDLVKFNEDSVSFKKEDITWALEAKIYSPHQNYNNKLKFFRNSLKGLTGEGGDWEKLNKYSFGEKYLLLYEFEIIDLKGDFDFLSENFPFLGTYLGTNEIQCKINIASVRELELIKNLKIEINKIFKDPDILHQSKNYQIGDSTNFLDINIHFAIIDANFPYENLTY